MLSACLLAGVSLPIAISQGPVSHASSGPQLIVKLHAEGAQLYECKTTGSGTLEWQFREPIASLMQGMRTVGRHYAGPSWELDDGSVVIAKVASQAPGATPEDIPHLLLEVQSHRGQGRLSGVTTIERVNTKGGIAKGACGSIGALRSVPYSADYALLRRTD
jgi:hypothetical protein